MTITVRNPDHKAFTIGKAGVLAAVTGFGGNLFRLMNGGTGLNYSVSLGTKKPGQYSAGNLFGKDILETAMPTSSKLKQPIELYELELSPFGSGRSSLPMPKEWHVVQAQGG